MHPGTGAIQVPTLHSAGVGGQHHFLIWYHDVHCHFIPPHRRFHSEKQHRLPWSLIAHTSYIFQHASWTWQISITTTLPLPHTLNLELGWLTALPSAPVTLPPLSWRLCHDGPLLWLSFPHPWPSWSSRADPGWIHIWGPLLVPWLPRWTFRSIPTLSALTSPCSICGQRGHGSGLSSRKQRPIGVDH